ncbi:MAG: hypothetical protein GY765_25285 [bacterium]|nr:hypothetical protein [bacterium]
MKRIITVLLTCCCLFIGCNIKKEIEPIDTQVEYRDAGDFHLTLSHDGLQRSYILYVPPGLQVGDTAPVVLVLHGATGSSAKMMGDTNIAMNQKADDEKFLVVYPQGTGDAQLDTYYWNAVHCCASAYDQGVDDIGFLRLLIETLISDQAADPSRVYVTGFSNGGMMAHRMGADLSDLIAAIAPVAGTIGGRASSEGDEVVISSPLNPVPIIIFHGMTDQEVPYWGGSMVAQYGRDDISVPRSVAFWTAHNNCGQSPVVENSPNGDYIKESYSPAPGGAPVILYAMIEKGHVWPVQLGDRRGTDIIWEFFSTQSQ